MQHEVLDVEAAKQTLLKMIAAYDAMMAEGDASAKRLEATKQLIRDAAARPAIQCASVVACRDDPGLDVAPSAHPTSGCPEHAAIDVDIVRARPAQANGDVVSERVVGRLEGDDVMCALAAQAEFDRTLMEFCASPKSLIGERSPDGCEVIRLTLNEGMSTESGTKAAADSIHAEGGVFLFGSLPFTAGCPWTSINKEQPGGKAKMRKHATF